MAHPPARHSSLHQSPVVVSRADGHAKVVPVARPVDVHPREVNTHLPNGQHGEHRHNNMIRGAALVALRERVHLRSSWAQALLERDKARLVLLIEFF